MVSVRDEGQGEEPRSAFQSSTFDRDVQIRVNEAVGSASISPAGRDVVLASREGLHIIDLDSPYSLPRHLIHRSPWEVADVQWSPFGSRDYWIASTSNQKALVWNLELSPTSPIEHTLHAHSRAITDINFSAHEADVLATCAVDSYIHCWDLRRPAKPIMSFADWIAGATQVKWNRQDQNILASSHDKFLKIWDRRKGAYPLRVIQAHTTKIYGLDWNRTSATEIITCSLDRTIKFWNYSKDYDLPDRVIRTPFPVWRARHTPFGRGLLAMPQRGDFNLHLYDQHLREGEELSSAIQPVHSFKGHSGQVKEFLWRSRGDIAGGTDNREFQLISWGRDRNLHLHRIDPQQLLAVGFQKGGPAMQNVRLTRKDAVYKTFQQATPRPVRSNSGPKDQGTRPRGLGALVTAAGMSKASALMAPVGTECGFMTPAASIYGRRHPRTTINPIKWMEGVKMGSRRADTHDSLTPRLPWDTPESLSDEMTFVARKYAKITFEKADVHRRLATVTLQGPWGLDVKPAFLRIHFEFPSDYPTTASPDCALERTASGISDQTMKRLGEEIKSITDHYKARGLGCLEAVITYLLGERGLEESISIPLDDVIDNGYALPADESSSDDDDAVGGPVQDLETSAADTLNPGVAQANAPIPRVCGACWSTDGRLVCFFPPKPEPEPLFSLDALRNNERGKTQRHFEGFGRIVSDSPIARDRKPSGSDDENGGSSGGSWGTSSPSSSDESEDISHLPSRFEPPSAWRAATLRYQKTSSHSSNGYGKPGTTPKPKSVISIHDFSALLPAKRMLASEYRIFGDGPEVCAHNAEVASNNGQQDIAAVWKLCEQILYDDVPLEIMEQAYRDEPILVLAKRNMVRVRRKESGLDLQFDDPGSVSNPKLRGRVKWGQHPFAGSWLIPVLFEYFERVADTQMLAMLSCIFSEPAVRQAVSNALIGLEQQELPIAMKAPAFSLDYFPSQEVAWSLFGNAPSRTNSGARRSPKMNDFFNAPAGTYGSAGSSNGPWTGDLTPSGPTTPFSTGNTPPAYFRRARSMGNSLSTSPETAQRAVKRSNSNLSTAFASLKPYLMASSPPVAERFRGEADLSTSAPTTGITWGVNTFYNDTSNSPSKRRRSSKRSSFAIYDSSYDSSMSDESDSSGGEYEGPTVQPVTDHTRSLTVRVTLKNQDRFDQEAHASMPLLIPPRDPKYQACREVYAEQLCAWGLDTPRAEVLKFSGLTPYWPPGSDADHDIAQTLNRLEFLTSATLSAHPPSKTSGTESKLTSVGSTSATPSLYEKDPSPLRDMYSRSSLQIDLGRPNGWEQGIVDPHRDTGKWQVSEKSRGVWSGQREKVRKADVIPANCRICLERIDGHYAICSNGVHMLHWNCYHTYVNAKGADDFDDDVVCNCPAA
ncbi:hypothetical protein EJ06DRAFT_195094 [Trichodelitschia bisporula]|uniref:RWD domain-containing protein n=1 Tax=Trichodelitschia bisporula TaxID=703511 RepID=A0A6G1I884_9PEZI|nr:hypothetical protein EJ06DRAFT_195094 [Trichodelitschia bisporula]